MAAPYSDLVSARCPRAQPAAQDPRTRDLPLEQWVSDCLEPDCQVRALLGRTAVKAPRGGPVEERPVPRLVVPALAWRAEAPPRAQASCRAATAGSQRLATPARDNCPPRRRSGGSGRARRRS